MWQGRISSQVGEAGPLPPPQGHLVGANKFPAAEVVTEQQRTGVLGPAPTQGWVPGTHPPCPFLKGASPAPPSSQALFSPLTPRRTHSSQGGRCQVQTYRPTFPTAAGAGQKVQALGDK